MILEITISLVSIKKSLYQCYPTYTNQVSSHRVLYLKLLRTYNTCIIYLHVTKACLKVTIVILYFWYHKFLILLSFKNLSDVRNKSLIRKMNLYFFGVMKNGHIFPSKVFHFQYDHGFLFRWETGNIRQYKEVRIKMKNHLGRAFPSHFRQNIFIDTSNVYYLALCHFLMASSLNIQSTLKDVFLITFSINDLQMTNMYFEDLFIGFI